LKLMTREPGKWCFTEKGRSFLAMLARPVVEDRDIILAPAGRLVRRPPFVTASMNR
jgi:hypothetical protein